MEMLRVVSRAFGLFAWAGVVSGEVAEIDEAPDVYEIVMGATATILPPALRDFFQDQQAAIRAAAITPSSDYDDSKGNATEHHRHFILMDAAARDNDAESRGAAVRKVPHEREDAKKWFREQEIRQGGTLPWVIEERFDALVPAFKNGNSAEAAEACGYLIHFVTDAALPFNTTAHFGVSSTNPLNESRAGRRDPSIQHRFHVELMRYLRGRLEHEVRVWPQRFEYRSNPIEAVFELLSNSNALLDEFAAVDRRIADERLEIPPSGSVVFDQGYYRRATELAAELLESRLEAGALLSAELIGSAWMKAGSPPIPVASTDAISQSDRPVKPALEQTDLVIVGSRSSNTYHGSTCYHAVRIKPENLVRFKTVLEAVHEGRRACSTCKPPEK